MTYTVTKTYTKQDDATFWPWEIDGYGGCYDDVESDGKLISRNFSEDGNTATSIQEWKSESDFMDIIVSKNDDTYASKLSLWYNYMKLNNISCRVVLPNGEVRVFNPSTQSFELE